MKLWKRLFTRKTDYFFVKLKSELFQLHPQHVYKTTVNKNTFSNVF